ncbi:MAG: TonB-dependent receptor [Bacteroidales bacterium]|nr:TonB-dependent receptor [Candidatus Physcousia equi]
MLACLYVNAQTTVKGILLDSLTNEPEPYATVRVYKGTTESQPIAMTLSGTEGQFQTTLNGRGDFTVVCAATAKQALMRHFTVGGEKEIDLGRLLLSEKESTMRGVEVTAMKPVVRMEADKITYSVEDDIDSRSMTVLDMLRKLPKVVVDGQDNITVSGQSSFKVYVDGKPNMMLTSNPSLILKAMPASMVASIEVITSPGAKYDAEGAGGIINICMAKTNVAAGGAQQLNGYNGSISANGGNRGGGISANVSGQNKRLSYNANFNYQYVDNGEVDVKILREQIEDAMKTDYHLKSKNTVPFIMGGLGLGYEIDSLSQVNASFDIQRFGVTNEGDPITRLYGGALGVGYAFGNHSKTKIGNTTYNGSLDYQRFFDAQHESSMTLTYQVSCTPSQKDSWTTEFYSTQASNGVAPLPLDRTSKGDEMTTEHVGQFDLVNKLTAHAKLNTGLKYAHRRSTSDMKYYDVIGGEQKLSEAMSSDYEHTNQIGAIYAESEHTWDRWSAKAGLRYEHTWQRYASLRQTPFKANYGNLVPSMTASWTIKPGQSLGATYNMRISRPGITFLNPYVDRSEPTSINYGQPNLSVEKNHIVSLVYNLYTPKFIMNATLSQAFDKGVIEEYSFYDKDGILNTTYGNIVDCRTTSLSFFASWALTRTTRLFFNGTGSYADLSSSVLDAKNYGWSGNAMLNVQQTLPKQWTLSAVVVANSRRLTLEGSTSGFNLGVLTLSKSLLKDRLNLSLTGVTGLAKGGKLHIDQFKEGRNFTSQSNISVPITRVVLTARWTFGNTQKQFQQRQSRVKSDYIEHQSSSESIGNAGKM